MINNADRTDYRFILLLASVLSALVICFSFSFVSNAAETEEIESAADTEQDQRLNALELRLEEMGYVINDVEMSIESIMGSLEQFEAERLSISQEVELLVIGISQLCDDNIAFTEKFDAFTADASAADLKTDTALTDINTSLGSLNENTVSGNVLITDLSSSIKTDMKNISETSINEFNETLLRTNTLLSYLFVLLLFVLVLIIASMIGSIFKNIINKNVV